ncbi:ETX/MTX2 family pore-forming toxin [Clostridiaceae bacterium M8S5]|nr:ETX/MTX2 family pore-forming toxin [Clostridiaceae bacterium M8S5]
MLGIDVQINAGMDAQSSSVKATGYIVDSISDTEIKSFGLTGKDFNKVFFDMYKQFPMFIASKKDAKREVVVKSAEILDITSEPIIVKTQKFINNSDVAGKFNVAISDTVTDSVTNSWSTTSTITVGQKIGYGIKFLGGGTGETSISYSQSWTQGGSHTTTITVGSTSGVTVDLEPGQSVLAVLSASRGKLNVKVVYEAYIYGTLYVSTVGGFIVKVDVQELLKRMNKPNSILTTENLSIGYYGNSTIELKKGDQTKVYFV